MPIYPGDLNPFLVQITRIAAALEKIANQQRAANMIAAGLTGEGVNLSREN